MQCMIQKGSLRPALTLMAALATGKKRLKLERTGAVSERQRGYLGTSKVGISPAACCVRAQTFKLDYP